MPLISILTLTYNRGYILKQLFDSLMKQTCFDFEWIIVDDGSIDDTETLVKSFKNDKFLLRYLKKENGGKHTAVNYGVKNINSTLTFIVDSDDYLTDDAVENIVLYYKKYKDNKSLAGFSFLRRYEDGNINTSFKGEDDLIGSYIDVRIKGNLQGDMAEVYYTSVLKRFPFPEYENEKFIGEDTSWVRIGKEYSLVYINKAIYVCSYLEDGLTKNNHKHKMLSPNGWYDVCKLLLTIKKLPFKRKIKVILSLIVSGKLLKYNYRRIIRDSNNSFMCFVLYLFGLLIYKKWKKKYLGK